MLTTEIRQLTQTALSPEMFYSGFLPRVVAALGAVGGAIWVLNPEGQLALREHHNFQTVGLGDKGEVDEQHTQLVYRVFCEGKQTLVPPSRASDDPLTPNQSLTPANPTEFLLVFAPVKANATHTCWVEVFQRYAVTDDMEIRQRGYLRFLFQMCELAGEFESRMGRSRE